MKRCGSAGTLYVTQQRNPPSILLAILGISFSTRIIGVVVLEDDVLCDYYTKYYQQKWSAKKRRIIVKHLAHTLQQHHITALTLAEPPVHYQTKNYRRIQNTLIQRCLIKQIPMILCTNRELISLFPAIKTKKQLMHCLSWAVPELEPLYQKELKNVARYYYKIFDAISVALLAKVHGYK